MSDGTTPMMLLHQLLESSAQRQPRKVALVTESSRITYGELADQAERFAFTLQRRGVRRGDRVAIFLDNCPELVVAVWATLKVGAIFVPINGLTKADKLTHLLHHARPVAIVTDSTLQMQWRTSLAHNRGITTCIVAGDALESSDGQRVLSYADAVRDDGPVADSGTIDQDLAAIIYTSGSTGDPKGVMLTHLNMMSAAASVSAYLQYGADDVILCGLPLAFGYGLYQVFLGFKAGATVVLLRSLGFPVQALEVMARERVTVLPAAPTFFAGLLNLSIVGDFDLSSLRMITNAAAPMSEQHIYRLRELFPQAAFFSMYGQTECKRVSYLPPDQLDRRPGSVGRGMPNQEVWLIDERGNRLPNGSTGELVVRGSHVMRGYWDNPRDTAERLKPGPYPGEYVLHSGDIFRTDEDGYLYFVSRKDDIIKSRGEKVSPREVEVAILAFDAVREVAVVGVPDELLGQAVKAFVVLRDGHSCTERDIIRHCLARLENFMAPKDVVFVDALPMTHNGKVAKLALA
jgi:amino acid adenylation domain-containing protein